VLSASAPQADSFFRPQTLAQPGDYFLNLATQAQFLEFFVHPETVDNQAAAHAAPNSRARRQDLIVDPGFAGDVRVGKTARAPGDHLEVA
jgi:hypothetical protein